MAPLLFLFLQASAYQQGLKAYAAQRFADSIPWFEKAAVGGSQALAAQYMLGSACLRAGQNDKALQAFAALFEVPPDSGAAHLLTAQMMLQAQRVPDAATEARRALERSPRTPQAHYVLGEAALAQGDTTAAIAEFEKEIEINPNFPMAFYRLGDAYVKRGAWQEAVSALQRSIWLNPNQSGPYLLIAKAYLGRGDREDAAGAAGHALEMNPQDQAARQLLDQSREPARQSLDSKTAVTQPIPGGVEFRAGRFQAAVPLLEKARASGMRSNELLFMLGDSCLQTHQIPQARAAFGDLFGLPADSGAAHLFTAQILIRLELEDDAQSELEAALSREPKLPQTHYMLGEIAIYRAAIDRAAGELKREIALNPAFAMAYYRLGDAYTRREDWDHAVPPLQRAIWLNPTYSGPYILLGKAYFKKGDLPESERMLRLALQMDPRNASAHYLLGRTLIQAGHAEEGKKLLREWQDLHQPSGREVN